MIEIWKFFNPSLIFFQTIREKVARYNYSSLQIHQPTMEYYIYERPSDYVDNRLKDMEIFDSTILRFSIFKIGREYILFLVQYVSTIL